MKCALGGGGSLASLWALLALAAALAVWPTSGESEYAPPPRELFPSTGLLCALLAKSEGSWRLPSPPLFLPFPPSSSS